MKCLAWLPLAIIFVLFGCNQSSNPFGKSDIKPSCVMNGFGVGTCQFTNTGNAPGAVCGNIVVNTIQGQSRKLTSNQFCSGNVAPSTTTEVKFHIPEVHTVCDPLFNFQKWSDYCKFEWEGPGDKQSQVPTLQQQNIPQNSSTNIAKTAKLSALIGTHASDVVNHPSVKQSFSSILGKDRNSFIERLDVADAKGIQRDGDWLVGSGCMPHLCGTDHAGFVINLNTGEIFAFMVVDDSKTSYFGADVIEKMPQQLRNLLTST